MTTITVYHLEMLDRSQFRPRYAEGVDGLTLREILPFDWRWNRRMYAEVGKSFHWVNRLSWTEEKWQDYAHRDDLKTVILEVNGVPAGYFEIERAELPSVELAYFGLVPEFIGKGLGAHLLSAAIEEAWQGDAKRVWVHTCSLDHRHALRNYQQRGFRIFKTETEEADIAELPADCLLRETHQR
jgi:GNAT superfamily N-acetyltransferase